MDSFAGVTGSHSQQFLFSPTLPVRKLSAPPKALRLPLRSKSRDSRVSLVRASSSDPIQHTVSLTIKTIAAGTVILSAATAGMLSGRQSWARADVPAKTATVESTVADADGVVQVEQKKSTKAGDASSLSDLLGSNSDAIDALCTLLYQKLEAGEDSEALVIIRRLMEAQPTEAEWKLLAARLLNEMGEVKESRQLLEEILATDPLSFEALFENAVLMDRCGEGSAVIERLERALDLAKAESKEAAARDVRLIMAQIQFLQKNVEEALSTYEELAREDPKDFRPYFCQGVIYTLLQRSREATEKFSKYKELSPKDAKVRAFFQKPLSRIQLFTSAGSEA
ncbi:hypothetical protein AXF42_Ash020626 [Apostasia shenzhenica]|uniref:Uncharacterized protein n=1 Tax=Apostasia shenzhenica TaxID=1088818 RepID=A0A2H9ZY60_9ASPA|nr:hypothetical protein AXF42_Ash020626 [Apostasia shenzhenica]